MESFPHALETLEGMRRYISAFRAPLQELSLVQIHTLRACSLLVIPPSKERVPPPRGFPMDLSDLNLSGWAGLVQDVASGLLVLPPNLGSDMSLPAVALLQLLEKTTGWGYCHYCCHLGSRCICMGAYPPAPPQSWSQVVDESPGYGATASSGGMTAPSTTAAGMSGYIPPPPGLPPIDFSNWRLPPPEAPASRGLPTAPPGLPGVGRSVRLRGMAKRIVGAQMAQHPGSLAQQTPTLPTLVLCAPQMATPLCQPPPGWLATPYQQAVQPPKKPTGRGVTSDPLQIKLPPWAAQVHRTVEDLTQEGGRWRPIRQSPQRCAGEGEGAATMSGGRSALWVNAQCSTTTGTGRNPASAGRSAKVHPLRSCVIGSKISQQWLEEEPGAYSLGLLQIQRCLL